MREGCCPVLTLPLQITLSVLDVWLLQAVDHVCLLTISSAVPTIGFENISWLIQLLLILKSSPQYLPSSFLARYLCVMIFWYSHLHFYYLVARACVLKVASGC